MTNSLSFNCPVNKFFEIDQLEVKDHNVIVGDCIKFLNINNDHKVCYGRIISIVKDKRYFDLDVKLRASNV